MSLLAPFLVRNSVQLFILSRAILGAVQGFLYPAFYCLFSKWIPSNERSTFIPWLDAGSIFGIILVSFSSGKIIVWFSKFGGWPIVFYLSGALALLWSLIWFLFVCSNPEDHPSITEGELLLLKLEKHHPKSIKPKWLKILTSPIFLGVLMTKILYGFVFDFVSLKIPAYLQDVISLEVDENGLSFSIIMIGYMLTLFVCGSVADMLIKHSSLSTGTVRKLFQLSSGLIMSISLSIIPNLDQSKWANVFLLATVMFGYGFTSGGDLPSIVDLSGPISGTVFALMNTLCSISGFVVPYIVGIVIEPDPNSKQLWKFLFYTASFIIVLGMMMFLISIGSSQLQTDWFDVVEDPNSGDSNNIIAHKIQYDESTTIKELYKSIAGSNATYNTFVATNLQSSASAIS